MGSAPYRIGLRPSPGYMFVIKHYGRWYLQDSEDLFYGPYDGSLLAITDRAPKEGRSLQDLPV